MVVNKTVIQHSWAVIERVLQKYSQTTAATLAAPATEKDISELEAVIGMEVPRDLAASLRCHNGQEDPTCLYAFCGDGILLGTAEIADVWKELTELDGDFRRNEKDWDSTIWWRRRWIPFTSNEGDSLCINLDSSLNSGIGEVVYFVHDNTFEPGIASSYSEWLSGIASKLKNGEFNLEYGEYIVLTNGT